MTKHQFTADLCARAIVASARAYGDDPIHALSVKSGRSRRSLSAAAYAIGQVTGMPQRRVSWTLKLGNASVSEAYRKGGHDFQLALTQALLAIGGPSAVLAAPSSIQSSAPSAPGAVKIRPAVETPTGPKAAKEAAQKSAKLAEIPISAGPLDPMRPAALPVPIKQEMAAARLQQIRHAAQTAPTTRPERLVAPKTCTWISDGAGACEAAVIPGKSYCSEHAEIVYQPSKPNGRRLEKHGMRLADQDRERKGWGNAEKVQALDGKPA